MVKFIIKNRQMNAFSLLEATVVMLIVAIFLAAGAKVFTQKHNRMLEKVPHGRFECYYKDSKLYQRYVYENTPREEQLVTQCTFRPVPHAPYYVINAVGGGGGGYTYGGSAGRYESQFVPMINENIIIKPGLGGAARANGGNTLIYNSNNELVITAAGGKAGSTAIQVNLSDIKSCSTIIHNQSYLSYCNETKQPSCTVNGANIAYNYCYSSGSINNNNSAWLNVSIENPQIVINSSVSLSLDFETNLLTNITAAKQESSLTQYIDAAGFDTVVKDLGDGGAKNAAGSPGAVIIVW